MNPTSVTPPLQSKFSHHDIFAIMLPGFMALVGLYLLANKLGLIDLIVQDFKPTLQPKPEESSTVAENFNLFSAVAISMGILIASHMMGEILQMVSISFSKRIWKAYGDIPYFWIRLYHDESTTHQNPTADCRRCCFRLICFKILFHKQRMLHFLPHSTIKEILGYIAKDSELAANSKLNKDIVISYYPRIKGVAYMSPTFKELCELVKVKADMYRAYGTLSVFFCISSLILLQQNISHDEHHLAWLNATCMVIFAILSIDLFRRYQARTIEFFSYLFEGFLNTMKGDTQNNVQQLITHITNNDITSTAQDQVQLPQSPSAGSETPTDIPLNIDTTADSATPPTP